jgi:hypothetical protein
VTKPPHRSVITIRAMPVVNRISMQESHPGPGLPSGDGTVLRVNHEWNGTCTGPSACEWLF